MIIYSVNLRKSLRNFIKIKQLILTENHQKPIILALIEPPDLAHKPSFGLSIGKLFHSQEILKSSKPKKGNEKIIVIHNKVCSISKIPLTSNIGIENDRCIKLELPINGQTTHLHFIHNFDLMNYEPYDFERHVLEYNIYSQIRKNSENTRSILMGDFNTHIWHDALNNRYGLNSTTDKSKNHHFINITSNVITNTKKHYHLSDEVNGSYWYKNNKFNSSKWSCLDQIHITPNIENNIKNLHYICKIPPDIDMIAELKKTNNTHFDHLPIRLEF